MSSSSRQRVTFLSKSKYVAGLQCLKLLWFHYNKKDQIPPPDAGTQAVFDQGHIVGDYAKRIFPDGIEIQREYYDIMGTIEDSRNALIHRKPLFEPGFEFNGGFARADVLNPVADNQWDIIEVKSSTEVKPVYISDAAFQLYVYKNAGIAVRKVFLYCINNQYVRHGEIEPKMLFAISDVTKDVNALLPDIPSRLEEMRKTIRQERCPEITIGAQCNDPYPCSLIGLCWDFLPAQNVTTLNRGGEKAFELLSRGIQKIKDIPSEYRFTTNQEIQKKSIESGQAQFDKTKIADFLKTLKYPLYYLDFETFATAIPLYDNVRPYLKVPFQYSLHIQRKPGAKLEHHSFLAAGTTDPRPEIMANLKALLGGSGSIIAYNAGFENDVLRKCCEFYPSYTDWYASIEKRFVDLMAPFRSFHYYHPDQNGSYSIKAILPSLVGKSYEGLDIHEGGTASLEYLRVTFEKVDGKEREKVRQQLEEYCKLDTYAMVTIVLSLQRLAM